VNPPICPDCGEPIVDMLEAYFDTYTGRVRHWPEAHRSNMEVLS